MTRTAYFLYVKSATSEQALHQALESAPERKEVYVRIVGKDRHGVAFDKQPWVKEFGLLLIRRFGGGFARDGVGFYANQAGESFDEDTAEMQVFGTREQIAAALREILEFLLRYAETTNQETVFLCINGHAHFLTPEEIRAWLKEDEDDV
ncbi:MAG TPA: hypothetical protein VH063_05420 [Gaiellaceae bacterium]|nr:hypothetical protein [Gaiellaceae bacterium]